MSYGLALSSAKAKGKRGSAPEEDEVLAEVPENGAEDVDLGDEEEDAALNIENDEEAGDEDVVDARDNDEDIARLPEKRSFESTDLDTQWRDTLVSLEKALGAKIPLWAPESNAVEISKLSFPTSLEISKMEPDAQAEFVASSAKLSLRAASTIKQLLQVQTVLEHGPQKEPYSLLLKDIEVQRSLTHMQRYIDTALWRHCSSVSRKVSRRVDQFLYDQSKPAATAEEPKRTFKDFYRQQMTAQFGDELDQLRQEKNFDESKISLLIDVLEAGVGLYDEPEKELLMLMPSEEKEGKQGAGANIFRAPKGSLSSEKERLPVLAKAAEEEKAQGSKKEADSKGPVEAAEASASMVENRVDVDAKGIDQLTPGKRKVKPQDGLSSVASTPLKSPHKTKKVKAKLNAAKKQEKRGE